MKTWFITGGASGFGLAFAEEALTRGDKVVITARNPENARALLDRFPKTALGLTLDVLDSAAVPAVVQKALDWAGSIDILVNNAGRGMHGAIEEASDAEVHAIFELNIFSLLAVTRAVLPGMRKQRSGHVFNLGSSAGLAGDAGTGMYSATKFALEGISEAMAAELAPLGIKVTVLEPGPFRTDFAGRSLLVVKNSIADYAETAGKRTAHLRAVSGTQPGDPKKFARLVCDVAAMETAPVHLVVGPGSHSRARGKMTKFLASINEWEPRTIATDFDA